MSCSSNRIILREELECYLDLVLKENCELERQRNELKATFHQRPQDEKNLMKNVLVIHNEFDGEIARVKEIIEEISTMPEDKLGRTARAEEIAKDMVKLQTELIRKHEVISKLVAQRQNYKHSKESARSQDLRLQDIIKENRFKLTEIENYEHGNLYSRKLKILNSEYSKLKSLSSSGMTSFSDQDPEVSGLSSAQASIKLQEVQVQNKKLEQDLGSLNTKFISKETYTRLKQEVDFKSNRILELKKLLKSKTEEIESLSSETATSPKSKLRLLTNIIGRRSPFSLTEQLSPRSMKLRSNTLLQDIESSLKRVRSIASPLPKT